jgi:hypothetical protein
VGDSPNGTGVAPGAGRIIVCASTVGGAIVAQISTHATICVNRHDVIDFMPFS